MDFGSEILDDLGQGPWGGILWYSPPIQLIHGWKGHHHNRPFWLGLCLRRRVYRMVLPTLGGSWYLCLCQKSRFAYAKNWIQILNQGFSFGFLHCPFHEKALLGACIGRSKISFLNCRWLNHSRNRGRESTHSNWVPVGWVPVIRITWLFSFPV